MEEPKPNPSLMRQAEIEARRVNHEYVGTEHVLLALLSDNAGVAARILKNLDVDPEDVRELIRVIKPGLSSPSAERLPLTPRAKRAIEYAIEEARSLGHQRISCEHVLLGLLHEGEGVAGEVLKLVGVRLGAVRREVQKLGQNESAS